MKKKTLLFLLLIGSFLVLTGCGGKEENTSGITKISYDYGSYHGGYYSYNITVNEDAITFYATGGNGVDLDINKEIEKDKITELEKIIKDNEIYNWDGFDEYDQDVYDGYGFTLKIEYKDGKKTEAQGYMLYPKNYDEGHKALVNYFESLYK